ncbi:MAG: hypothetical protein ACE5QV_09380, partial [Fidelibacterota bacterium]
PSTGAVKSIRKLLIKSYNRAGENLLTLNMLLEYDDPLPELFISDYEGYIVISNAVYGELIFLNSAGDTLRRAYIFQQNKFSYERNFDASISQDGEFFVLGTMEKPAHPVTGGLPVLIFYSMNGREFWRRDLEGFSSGGASISYKGKFLSGSSYYYDKNKDKFNYFTYLFDSNGNILKRLPFLSRKSMFSKNLKYFLGANKKEAFLLNLETFEIMWSRKISSGNRIICDLYMNDSGNSVILTAFPKYRTDKFKFVSPIISYINNMGEVIWNREFPEDYFFIPAIKLSDDSRQIAVSFGKELKIFQIEN